MPLVGFGTWQLSGRAAYEATRQALDAGYRHIDTATMYRNEREIGRAVQDSDVPREQIFVTTKVPADNVGRERETLGGGISGAPGPHPKSGRQRGKGRPPRPFRMSLALGFLGGWPGCCGGASLPAPGGT